MEPAQDRDGAAGTLNARRGQVDATVPPQQAGRELLPPGSKHRSSNSSGDSSPLRRHPIPPTIPSYIEIPSSSSLSTGLAALTPPPPSPTAGTIRPPRIRYGADWNPSPPSPPSLLGLLTAFNASHLWLALYFCFSVAMTLSNKFLLRGFFPYVSVFPGSGK